VSLWAAVETNKPMNGCIRQTPLERIKRDEIEYRNFQPDAVR
jgi:hypothetical protein